MRILIPPPFALRVLTPKVHGHGWWFHPSALTAWRPDRGTGSAYVSPSDAASAIAGKRTGGWWFFLTDQTNRISLRKIRRDYVNAMAFDEQEDEPDDDDDEN